MAWLRTRAPNGDRAGVIRCSEGDHAGHIREVPQEEYSPSMYIAQSGANHEEESLLIDHILQVLLRKLQSKRHNGYTANVCMNFLVTAKYPLALSNM
jgi:hypothetical protein